MSLVGTKLLYITVYIILGVLASGIRYYDTDKNRSIQYVSKSQFLFYTMLLITVLLFTCTNIGVDYKNYAGVIERFHTFEYVLRPEIQEPGFTFLSAVLFHLFKKSDWVIFLIKTMSILLVFHSIHIVRDKVNVFYSIMAFVSIAFFAEFYLLSICLAGSLVLYGYALYLDGKFIRCIIALLCAGSIHYTAIIMLFPIVLLCILGKGEKRKFSKFKFLILILTYIMIFVLFERLYILLINGNSVFSKYSIYSLSSGSSFGVVQTIYYLPVFIGIYLVFKNKIYDKFTLLGIVVGVTCFTLAELGYKVSVLNRTYIYSLPVFCIFVPYMIRKVEDGNMETFISVRSLKMIIFTIILFRLSINFYEYMILDSPAMVNHYNFFFPWKG